MAEVNLSRLIEGDPVPGPSASDWYSGSPEPEIDEREESVWESGHNAGRAFERRRLEGLIRRAAPFVEAVAVMADDRTKALAWLADAVEVVGREEASPFTGDETLEERIERAE